MAGEDLFQNSVLHADAARTLFRRLSWMVPLLAAWSVATELGRPTRSSWVDLPVTLFLPAWLLTLALSMGWPPRAQADRDANGLVLRFTPGWRYGVRAFFIVPMVGLAALVAKGSGDPVARAVLASIAVAGIVLAALYPRERFRLTGEGVARVSPWTGRVATLRWPDVTRVELDATRRSLAMRGPGATIKVKLQMDGIGDFAAQALSSLPGHVVDAGRNVRPALETLARRLQVGAPAATGRAGFRSRPAMAAVALVAVGLAVWSRSMWFEVPLRVPIPEGWIDVSPGAPQRDLAPLPPKVREAVRAQGWSRPRWAGRRPES